MTAGDEFACGYSERNSERLSLDNAAPYILSTPFMCELRKFHVAAIMKARHLLSCIATEFLDEPRFIMATTTVLSQPLHATAENIGRKKHPQLNQPCIYMGVCVYNNTPVNVFTHRSSPQKLSISFHIIIVKDRIQPQHKVFLRNL